MRRPQVQAGPGGHQVAGGNAEAGQTEVDDGGHLAVADEEVGRVRVAVQPDRRAGPGRGGQGLLPDGQSGGGVEPAVAGRRRGSDRVIVGGQRDAAEVAGRGAGRVQGTQGGHEAGQGDRRLLGIGDRGQGGDLAWQPRAHHPGPRIALTGLALPELHRNGQRQPWPYDRQPPVLVFQVVGAELAARQPEPRDPSRGGRSRCRSPLPRRAPPAGPPTAGTEPQQAAGPAERRPRTSSADCDSDSNQGSPRTRLSGSTHELA